MKIGLDQTRVPKGETLYQTVFFREKTKFQYPPSSLLLPDLLDRVSPQGLTEGVLNGISWGCIVLLGVLVPAIYIAAIKKFSPDTAKHLGSRGLMLQAIVLSLMAMTFYPVTRGFYLGQIQTWLTCLFAASVLAWITGNELIAGVLIGVIASVKPQLALLLAWGAFHGCTRFFIGSASTLLVLEGVALWRYGLKNLLDYLSVLSFMSAHGESFYPNQSVNGLLGRMLHIGNNTQWLGHEFPPFHPVVYYGTLASSVLMIALAVLWGRKDKSQKGRLVQFLVASLLVTMASPIAWEHHYGIMVAIYAVFFAIVLEHTHRARWLICIAISYVFASNCFSLPNLAANTSWNFVQSYLFAAAAGLVVIGCRFSKESLGAIAQPQAAHVPESLALPMLRLWQALGGEFVGSTNPDSSRGPSAATTPQSQIGSTQQHDRTYKRTAQP